MGISIKIWQSAESTWWRYVEQKSNRTPDETSTAVYTATSVKVLRRQKIISPKVVQETILPAPLNMELCRYLYPSSDKKFVLKFFSFLLLTANNLSINQFHNKDAEQKIQQRSQVTRSRRVGMKNMEITLALYRIKNLISRLKLHPVELFAAHNFEF